MAVPRCRALQTSATTTARPPWRRLPKRAWADKLSPSAIPRRDNRFSACRANARSANADCTTARPAPPLPGCSLAASSSTASAPGLVREVGFPLPRARSSPAAAATPDAAGVSKGLAPKGTVTNGHNGWSRWLVGSSAQFQTDRPLGWARPDGCPAQAGFVTHGPARFGTHQQLTIRPPRSSEQVVEIRCAVADTIVVRSVGSSRSVAA